MLIADYYQILGLTPDASVAEIKQAYRQKARLYHPDVNPASNAQERFIAATEAYDFLITYSNKISTGSEPAQVVSDWHKQSQERSRRRAYVYARGSYSKFTNSKLYRTTKILDSTAIVFSFVISVMIIVCMVTGYFYRLKHPLPDIEKPSLPVFILMLVAGVVFFVVSLIFLTIHLKSPAKNKKAK